MINANIGFIRERISKAALKRGVEPKEIVLVAVSKFVELDKIRQAAKLGITVFGESRIQEASIKVPAIKDVSWHMIGHLQTNKSKKAVELFDLIQSLDSIHLAEAINTCAARQNKIQNCLAEVNIGSEESKYGIKPEDVRSFLESVSIYKNIRIQGLMTIAPNFDDKESLRPYFKRMKELFDSVKKDNAEIKYLSMGMSGDFDIAIEEGSNMVRIGTAIFGGRT